MRPHDLLHLRPGALTLSADAPRWVAQSLARAPFVVVRRAELTDDRIPVGVRGQTRAERHAMTVDLADVDRVITPEMIAASAAWRTHARRDLPAFTSLDALARAAGALDLAWGPGGSVGFELASGVPAVNDESDLDVILRPTSAHRREDLERFEQSIDKLPIRVDVVIESALGAVVLSEWLRSPQRALIKTQNGPRLGVFRW